jgi:hypothetical protein
MPGETDVPRAAALLREALARARAAGDPPYDPPPEYAPTTPSRGGLWRGAKFPEVRELVGWLDEMFSRSGRGEPPTTEAEFGELAAWLAANEDRLRALATGGYVSPGGDEKVPLWYVTAGARRGPRAGGAGVAAHWMRGLRATYGGGPAPADPPPAA